MGGDDAEMVALTARVGLRGGAAGCGWEEAAGRKRGGQGEEGGGGRRAGGGGGGRRRRRRPGRTTASVF
jgi:hypothetical protein